MPYQLQKVGAPEPGFYLYTEDGPDRVIQPYRRNGTEVEGDPPADPLSVAFVGRALRAPGFQPGSRMAKDGSDVQTIDFLAESVNTYSAGGSKVPSSPVYRPTDMKVYWCEVEPLAAPDPYPVELWKANPDLTEAELVHSVSISGHGASEFYQDGDVENGLEPAASGVLLWVKARVSGITRYWRVFLGYDGSTTDQTAIFSPGFDPGTGFRSGILASGGRTIVQATIPSLQETDDAAMLSYVDPVDDLTAVATAWGPGTDLVDFTVSKNLGTVWGLDEDGEEFIRYSAGGTQLEAVTIDELPVDPVYGITKLED